MAYVRDRAQVVLTLRRGQRIEDRRVVDALRSAGVALDDEPDPMIPYTAAIPALDDRRRPARRSRFA